MMLVLGSRLHLVSIQQVHAVFTVLMTVVVQLGFIENKKEHHTAQQQREQVIRRNACLQGLRQQLQQCRSQQGTGGEAQHVLGQASHDAKAQQGRNPYAANPGHHRAGQNPKKYHLKL